MSDLEGVENAPVTDAPIESESAPEQGAPANNDLSAIRERMEQMSQEQAERLQALESRFAPQESEDDADDLYPLNDGDDGYEDQEAERLFREAVAAEVEKRLTPFQREQQIKERDDEFAAFLDEYPDMQDQKYAAPIIQKAQGLIGNDPRVIESPQFVELIETVYKATKADERAAQEKPAGGRREVVLEGGQGRAPAEPEENLQERILKAAQGLGGI